MDNKKYKYKGSWERVGTNIDNAGIKLLTLEYNELLELVKKKSIEVESINNQPQLKTMYKVKLNIEGFRSKEFTNLFYKLQTKELLEKTWQEFN